MAEEYPAWRDPLGVERRGVGQRATEYCRRSGYAVPNDSWLGR